MAVRPMPGVLALKDVELVVDVDDYCKSVSTVRFTPSSSDVTWQGLSPDATYTSPTTSTWACSLTYAQDWDDPDSLSNYLHDNEGEPIGVVFRPKRGGASWAATLFVRPGDIGGDVNTVATASVTLGVVGRPVRTAAPAGG